MDNNTILEVKDLTVAFGGNRVVDNISYTLRRGRTLGIVGESGSGKSVSSMALMGLLPKSATVTGTAFLSQSDFKIFSNLPEKKNINLLEPKTLFSSQPSFSRLGIVQTLRNLPSALGLSKRWFLRNPRYSLYLFYFSGAHGLRQTHFI